MITYILIGITVVVSLLAFNDENLKSKLLFYPVAVNRAQQYYRFITSGFVHSNFFHLFFNMYALYLFGRMVEDKLVDLYGIFGLVAFLALYISALFMSDTYSYLKHKDNPSFSSLGASGAVAAVLFASIIIYPTEKYMIMPIPIFLPSYILGPIYLAYSYYMSDKNLDNIEHNAHFFGAIWGIIFILILWHDAIPNFIAQVF